MTDQEIRDVILKTAYDAKNAGGVAYVSKISEDCGQEIKQVISNVNCLRKRGLVKHVVRGRAVFPTEVEITEKGIDEYERKCR